MIEGSYFDEINEDGSLKVLQCVGFGVVRAEEFCERQCCFLDKKMQLEVGVDDHTVSRCC